MDLGLDQPLCTVLYSCDHPIEPSVSAYVHQDVVIVQLILTNGWVVRLGFALSSQPPAGAAIELEHGELHLKGSFLSRRIKFDKAAFPSDMRPTCSVFLGTTAVFATADGSVTAVAVSSPFGKGCMRVRACSRQSWTLIL